MTSMIKFIDANVFIRRWDDSKVRAFVDSLEENEYATSTLVLTEVFHKLSKKKIQTSFEYVRSIMGAIRVFDVTQSDLFNAMKSSFEININDKIHIQTMKRHGINTIISFDKDFDRDKTIRREIID